VQNAKDGLAVASRKLQEAQATLRRAQATVDGVIGGAIAAVNNAQARTDWYKEMQID
jgi:hypothetical protein